MLMNKTISFLSLTLVLTAVCLIPDLALAGPDPSAGAEGRLVPCSGSDCTFCHVIELGNDLLNWLFGIIFVLFGVIAFMAGFGLVTSGGNPSKLDEAKKKLSNALVGVIIVLAAWLMVDTLMKALIPDGDTSLGPWHTIDCGIGGQSEATWTAPSAAEEDDVTESPHACYDREWRNIGPSVRACTLDADGSYCTWPCDECLFINNQRLHSVPADPPPEGVDCSSATGFAADIWRRCLNLGYPHDMDTAECVNWEQYYSL